MQIRPHHKERLVKIFAQVQSLFTFLSVNLVKIRDNIIRLCGNFGLSFQNENCINRPVCSYIKPLRAGRLLDTPRQAARFVSLIGYEKTSLVGGGEKPEQWSTMHSFLCRNKGVSFLVYCCLCLYFFTAGSAFVVPGHNYPTPTPWL